jgi:hypothetical protein
LLDGVIEHGDVPGSGGAAQCAHYDILSQFEAERNAEPGGSLACRDDGGKATLG